MWVDLGLGLALVLTLMVYSYLIGDNMAFRLAEHILVGVSVGWATLQIIFNLIIPAIDRIQETGAGIGQIVVYTIPLLLGVIILFRPIRAARPATNLVMAVVIGTVSALALAGAVAGTLLPQIGATMLPLNQGGITDIIGGIVLVIGTLTTLWYFQFTTRKVAQSQSDGANVLSRNVHLLGRWSIMLAFGAVFASVFLTYFAALVDRLLFLLKIQF
jgi:hypothetical protein